MAATTASPALSNSPKSSPMKAPEPSLCAPDSPIRRARCCRECSSRRSSPRRSSPTCSWCRSRPSSATSAAKPLSSSSGRGNKAVKRNVNATRTYGADWVVSAGLHAGDKVITQGTANLRTGGSIQAGPAGRPAEDCARQAGRGRWTRRRGRRLSFVTDFHRPADLRLGHCDRHHARRHRRDLLAADRAISRCCAATGQHPRQLPGRVGRDDREQRHPDHRAAADRASTACSISPRRRARADRSAFRRSSPRAPTPTSPRSRSRTRFQQAVSRLPQQVQQQGVRVTKSNPDFLLIVAVYDATDTRTNMDVSDYLASNIQDPLSRVPGVGDVNVFGAPHAMRIWLNPQRLAAFSLMPSDVVSAIQAQNTEVAAGEVGGLPQPDSRCSTRPSPPSRKLQTPEQFRADHPQDRSERRVGPARRRRSGRAWRRKLQLDHPRQRPSRRGHRGFARAGRGRAEDGRAGQASASQRAFAQLPRRHRLRLRQRHHGFHQAVGRGGRRRPCSKRSSSSSSSSSCSCRTGARCWCRRSPFRSCCWARSRSSTSPASPSTR